jgi:ketosteroid isomerase-like protein
VIICNNCGIALEDGLRFCSECGAEVLSVLRSTTVPPVSKEVQHDESSTAAASGHQLSPAKATTRLADPPIDGGKAGWLYPSGRFLALAITAAGFLLLVAAGLAWLIFGSKGSPTVRGASGAPNMTVGASASAGHSGQSVDAEVTSALSDWVSALEAHDLDAHMGYFADTLDTYHSLQNVSASRVRADLARAFSRYSTLSVRLSNLQVTVDRSNANAVVTFDKAWVFANGPGEKTFSGSVRQTVWLRQVNRRWLISGLKDL